MSAVIGVTASCEEQLLTLKHHYTDCIIRAGGVPLIIPFNLSADQITHICGMLSGLLLTGGADIDPDYFGEQPLPGLGTVTPERDRLEVLLTREFIRQRKPILAVCRGHQVLNVAMGGTLYQDIYTQCKTLQHSQKAPRSHLSHKVKVAEGSIMHRIAEAGEIKVNSFHHQAIKQPAPGFIITAKAEDGIIEAIESTAHKFVVGVQWHPEDTAVVDSVSRRLFASFVESCIM